MEPLGLITLALSAAITGVTHGTAQGLLQGAAEEAYHDLKTLIKRKFASEPKAEMILEEYEQDPKTYEVPLKKKLAEAGADKDEEIIKKAQELMKQLQLEESKAGKYKVEFQSEVKGIQVGDRNVQENKFG